MKARKINKKAIASGYVKPLLMGILWELSAVRWFTTELRHILAVFFTNLSQYNSSYINFIFLSKTSCYCHIFHYIQ